MESSFQRTMPVCKRKIKRHVLVRGEGDAALGIGAQPGRLDLHAVFARRQFFDAIDAPARSDRTKKLIFVFVFCAWTNAPSTGAPSGPFTVPETVAP